MNVGFTIAIISKPDMEMQKTFVGESSGFRVTDGSKYMNCPTSAQIKAALCLVAASGTALIFNFICRFVSRDDREYHIDTYTCV